MTKILFLSFSFLFHSTLIVAQEGINIIPRPEKITIGKGYFVFSDSTRLITEDSGMNNAASFFRNYMERFHGQTIILQAVTSDKDEVQPKISLKRSTSISGNGYLLDVNEKILEISAGTDTGIFYGIQSLIQLLPVVKSPSTKNGPVSLPVLKVFDSPRFNYRGMHLDVARHFFDTAYLKKFIDLLALHKFNKFHWHLTDDQGWRMEVKKYPLLTVTGSCRKQTLIGRFGSDRYDRTVHCGYYSVEQMKDIISFAASRYITVIPEVDMPGHTTAALAAYPYLGCTKGPYEVSQTWGVHKEVMCAGNDSTYAFINDVIGELVTIFPSKMIHIGGDEVPKDRWKACSVCRERMRKEGLKNEAELQSYFINRVKKIVNSHGRIMIGWDEILEGKDVPGTIIMNWRGRRFAEEAFRLGHPVIFTPDNPLYLNFSQSDNEDSLTQGGNNTLEKVYNFDPFNTLSSSTLVLGIQANLWTEYISNTSKLEYMMLPRLSAVSEAAWSKPEKKDFRNFESRLPEMINRYKMWGFNFSSAHFGLQHETISLGDSGIGWKLFSRYNGKIYYGNKEDQIGYEYTRPIPVLQSNTLFAKMADSAGRQLGSKLTMHFNVNKATGKKVTLRNAPNLMYPGRGGFTLVDGAQNSVGMEKSAQFLGFIGDDLDATIDLGKTEKLKFIRLHAFEQKVSGIYAPERVKFFSSVDGRSFQVVPGEVRKKGIKDLIYEAKVGNKARYIQVVARNHGVIKAGMEGSGRRAWLFVDEIEVD